MPRRRHAAVVVLVAAAATAFATSPAGAAAGSHAADSIAAGSTAPATSISTAHAAPAPSAPTGSASPTPAYRSYTARSKGIAPRSQDPITVKKNIYYVANNDSGNRCTGETGDGSWADPFCQLQSAVDAASPGDTIAVIPITPGQSPRFAGPVSITKSGLTIAGQNAAAITVGGGQQSLVISGASGVKISGLALSGTVSITGSSDITLDADYMVSPVLPTGDGGDGVDIDGTSSDITVSRSMFSVRDGQFVQSGAGVRVAAGAKDVDIASDIFSHLGGVAVAADGADGLDVVGDTIQRACNGALSISGGSTGVALENNVIEDAVPGDGDHGNQSDCTKPPAAFGWAPDVTVTADSVAGTTTDYNDFYVFFHDATGLYDWNGTTYTTPADFQAAVNQGAHDVGDSTADGAMVDLPGGTYFVDAVPQAGSAAVGSANPQAPGALSSDFYGIAPYRERGAIALGDTPMVTQLVVDQSGAQSVQATAASTSSARPAARYNFNWGDGSLVSSSTPTLTHRYDQVGTYTISVTVGDGLGYNSTASVTDFVTAGSDFTPYGPTRLLDTRNGTGTGGAKIPVPPFGTIKLKVAGNGAIPANAEAVALNVTATAPTASGYITAFPNGSPRPVASVIDFSPGRTTATMTVSAIGADGEVDLYNGSAGTVHLIADASGYFAPVATNAYESLSPVRILDTKTGLGGYSGTTVTQGRPVVLKIDGAQGVPAAKAVAVNITVANPTQGGYLTAFPHLQSQPTVSNIDFDKGETRANAAIVPVGSDGDIELALNTSGAARLIVDVDGVFVPGANGGAAYVPVVPYRYFDTRLNDPKGLPGFFFECLPLAQKGGALNPVDAGYVLNVTAINPGTSGYMTVYPDRSFGCADSPGVIPNTSTLDFAGHQTVPNMAIVSPGDFGDVDFLNGSGASLQFAVDVYGVFLND